MSRRSSRLAWIATTCLLFAGLFWLTLVRVGVPRRVLLPFSVDRDCAIAVTDDTDKFQLDTTAPVYDALNEAGWRVTKTVWAFDTEEKDPANCGLSLDAPDYLAWVKEQARRGHEIVLHSATAGDDDRKTTIAAHERIRTLFGAPRVEIFHQNNKEAFYWGGDRLPWHLLGRVYLWKSPRARFYGQDPTSPYYWVDISRKLVRYVRTYTAAEIDTWALNPSMPYEDPRTPKAPLWFASSNGRAREQFVKLLSERNVRRLSSQHGVSIVYTHFSSGFVDLSQRPGHVWPDVAATIRRLGADHRVELLPAGDVLDRLRAIQLIERSLSRGEKTIALPTEILPTIANLSVDSSADGPKSVNESGRMRSSMKDWLASKAVLVVGTPRDVFEHPVRLGWRERWRMVILWILEQAVSPT